MIIDSSNPFDVKKADVYYEKLKSQKAKFEINKPREKRSVDQNSFLHVCLGYFCLHTGYTLNEAKCEFADMLPELMIYEKNGKNYRRSTSDLDSKEMTILIDYIRNFCNEQLGVYIPDPEDYLINQFKIRKELEHVT